jgi:hypothetical protein
VSERGIFSKDVSNWLVYMKRLRFRPLP